MGRTPSVGKKLPAGREHSTLSFFVLTIFLVSGSDDACGEPVYGRPVSDVQNFDVATTAATAKEFMNVGLGFDETQYG